MVAAGRSRGSMGLTLRVSARMPPPTIDEILGNYRVVRPMGEGGMGAVFEAVHTKLDRRAALKVLHAHLAGDPQIAARFL